LPLAQTQRNSDSPSISCSIEVFGFCSICVDLVEHSFPYRSPSAASKNIEFSLFYDDSMESPIDHDHQKSYFFSLCFPRTVRQVGLKFSANIDGLGI
jgi:hypothetical protein